MAPRALLILTCFRQHVADVPVPAKENARGSEKRRWTGEIKRKILATVRRPRIWSVSEEEEPCDVNVVKTQRAQAPEPKVPEQQAPPRREAGAQVLQQSDRSRPSTDGAPPDAVAVDVDGRRKRKDLRVRFDLPPQEISAAPPVESPRFPTGVLGEPPRSFAHSGADMTAAFLMSVVIAGKSSGTDDSAAQVDRDLVACWTERKAACSRRLRYLRDYCPFQREEEEAEDDESELLETTTRPEAAEPGHVEVWPVKTGLPFDSPESEAEFAMAIRSRYLLEVKGDFLFCHAYERSRDRAAESLMAAGEGNIVQELKV